MAKINIKSIAFVLLFFVATTAVAAPPTIKATIDSTTMLMGNKTNVRVTVVKDKTASGELFIPQDTLVKNVEVAEKMVTIKSAMKQADIAEMEELAESLLAK